MGGTYRSNLLLDITFSTRAHRNPSYFAHFEFDCDSRLPVQPKLHHDLRELQQSRYHRLTRDLNPDVAHLNPTETMKAHVHRIIETVQRERRQQLGVNNPRKVIFVTPTYDRTFQTLHLTRVMHC
ncbi:hypothetical protein ACLB2K_036736 [Fragaria x ananassa]